MQCVYVCRDPRTCVYRLRNELSRIRFSRACVCRRVRLLSELRETANVKYMYAREILRQPSVLVAFDLAVDFAVSQFKPRSVFLKQFCETRHTRFASKITDDRTSERCAGRNRRSQWSTPYGIGSSCDGEQEGKCRSTEVARPFFFSLSRYLHPHPRLLPSVFPADD